MEIRARPCSRQLEEPRTSPTACSTSLTATSMALCHVSLAGRDRRHLTALGTKLRVVVVGYREEKGEVVVDAYIESNRIPWLERQGYRVLRFEEVEHHDRQRQAEGRRA